MNIDGELKYSLSKSGKQCIGPCYEANKPIVHPYTLEYIVSNKPFCPVAAFKKLDPKTGHHDFFYFDDCYESKNNHNIYDSQMNILIPEIEFSCSQFLKLYYNITSFDDFLTWIANNKAPIRTKFRIMNCALNLYSSSLELIDDRFIILFIEIVSKLWINDIYRIINKYILIDNNMISLDHSKKVIKLDNDFKNILKLYEDIEPDEDEYSSIKIKFIIDKLINKNIVYNFLNKYILPKDYANNIKLSYLQYILIKIDKTISQI